MERKWVTLASEPGHGGSDCHQATPQSCCLVLYWPDTLTVILLMEKMMKTGIFTAIALPSKIRNHYLERLGFKAGAMVPKLIKLRTHSVIHQCSARILAPQAKDNFGLQIRGEGKRMRSGYHSTHHFHSHGGSPIAGWFLLGKMHL